MKLSTNGFKGFSIFELLVVVVVIALLAALLMPLVKSAMQAVVEVKCVSNERQIMQATMQYAQDQGGRLPTCWGMDDSGQAFGFWNQLRPYLPGSAYNVLFCPAWPWTMGGQPSPYVQPPGGGFDSQHGNYGDITYGAFYFTQRIDYSQQYVMNWTYDPPSPPSSQKQTRLASLPQPSRTMAYACAGSDLYPPSYTIQLAQLQPGSNNPYVWNSQSGAIGAFVHKGKRNFVFLDGHVEKFDPRSSRAGLRELLSRFSAADEETFIVKKTPTISRSPPSV